MGRNNVYTYWVEKRMPPTPVRYEMLGYDTLLTSYYDKYVIDYTSYEKWKYDKAMFDIPQSKDAMFLLRQSGTSGSSVIEK